ncbi:MAG: EamA family transporter [Actinomycetota bacterium]|nr:EamA family transporter [Actinomycetota bacterium]
MADGKDKGLVLTETSLVMAAVFWGSNFAATKYATDSIPPLLLIAIRFAVGGILLFAILRFLSACSELGMYQYLIAITGVASGILFFGESLGINKLFGGAVILVVIYLARRLARRQ